jgi:FeS assembly protein IscX
LVIAKLPENGDNDMDAEEHYPIYWEPTYEIVIRLMETYPNFDIESVGYQQLMNMIVALPDFVDDPAIATEELLRDILREWYEEATAE